MIKLRFQASGIAAAMARGSAALAVGGVLTLVAAGCAGQVGSAEPADAQLLSSAAPEPDLPPPSPSAPQIHPRWRSCASEPSMQQRDDGPDAMMRLRLLDTFRPVAAVMCGEGTQRRPDGGTDAVAVEDRVDEVTALLAALRLPDAPSPSLGPSADDVPPDMDTMCTLDGYSPPRLVLLDGQGRWVRPGIPRNDCGKPLAEVTAAMDKLRWTRVTTRVLQEIESAEAAASGCSEVFTDMVWFTGFYPPIRQGELAPLADDAAAVRLCIYRVKASEPGDDKPQGYFVSGGLLPPGRWAAVKREVQASRPATPCTTPANRFALLTTPQGDIHVELDGCRRLVAQAVRPGDDTSFDTLRQAPTVLPALLTEP